MVGRRVGDVVDIMILPDSPNGQALVVSRIKLGVLFRGVSRHAQNSS